MITFEWDPDKSAQNEEKHGISFEAAMAVWESPRLEIPSIARSKDSETRSAILGLINGHIYCVIWTKRGKNIRIISARRARNEERKAYVEALQNL